MSKPNFKSYGEASRSGWGRDFPPGGTIKIDELSAGALVRLADAVELLVVQLASITHRLCAIERALEPRPLRPSKPARTAEDQKQSREAASRRRAWEAYQRAGGAMEPEGDDRDGDDDPDSPGAPIAVLDLSVRARRAVAMRLGCKTVADLQQKTARDLLQCRNFGPTTLHEVREKLAARGWHLKGESLDAEPT